MESRRAPSKALTEAGETTHSFFDDGVTGRVAQSQIPFRPEGASRYGCNFFFFKKLSTELLIRETKLGDIREEVKSPLSQKAGNTRNAIQCRMQRLPPSIERS